MSHTTYSPYHPRWYRKRVSTYWWAERAAYFLFILRELSSIFIAWLIVFVLFLIRAVSQGEAQYQQFLAWATHPTLLALNAISLAFVVLHAVTWFNLAPKALVLRLRGRQLPPAVIAASNYGAWFAVSAAIVWLLLGS